MTHRERMLATLRGEPSDRIPWAPRMDLWYIALNERGALPPGFQGKNTAEMADELGSACHAIGADFTLKGGRDVSLRGLGIDNHQDYPFRVELKGLDVDFDQEPEDLKTRIVTSAGEVFTHLHLGQRMRREGISLPFVKSYAIESTDDFDAVGEVFEHLDVIPTPEAYGAFVNRIGDRGVAVARGPIAACPMHLVLHELAAMDQFFYLYTDSRDALRSLVDRIAPFFDRLLDVLAESEAEVIFWGGNYDQDLTWPPFFKEEIAPWLKKVADRLHAAGKHLLTHCDGENRNLLPLYPECGFDIAESVCPRPMTQLSLQELREGFGPDVTVFGGIPSICLLEDSMSETEFEDHLDELFKSIGTGDHLILGVSDNVPPDASLARLRRIGERIEAFGPVAPP